MARDTLVRQQAANRHFALWMLLYAAAIAGGAVALSSGSVPLWGVILLSLAPAAVALIALRFWLQWFAALDEVQRTIQTETILISIGVVAIGSLSYGFLEFWAGFPAFPIVFFAPLFCTVMALVRLFVERRYK